LRDRVYNEKNVARRYYEDKAVLAIIKPHIPKAPPETGAGAGAGPITNTAAVINAQSAILETMEKFVPVGSLIYGAAAHGGKIYALIGTENEIELCVIGADLKREATIQSMGKLPEGAAVMCFVVIVKGWLFSIVGKTRYWANLNLNLPLPELEPEPLEIITWNRNPPDPGAIAYNGPCGLELGDADRKKERKKMKMKRFHNKPFPKRLLNGKVCLDMQEPDDEDRAEATDEDEVNDTEAERDYYCTLFVAGGD
jgi:hypothetical protein